MNGSEIHKTNLKLTKVETGDRKLLSSEANRENIITLFKIHSLD
jgi:hypothetical protein